MSRGTTSIYMKKENALICKMEASQLGFSSVEDFLMMLVNVRKRLKFSKLDLTCLRDFGQIPKVELLTPEQLKKKGFKPVTFEEQTGVKADVAKNFTEKGLKVTAKIEKRVESPEIDQMPKSEEFFKNKKVTE